jgi:hypothetical protein
MLLQCMHSWSHVWEADKTAIANNCAPQLELAVEFGRLKRPVICKGDGRVWTRVSW